MIFAVEPLPDVQNDIVCLMDSQEFEMGVYENTKADPNWPLYHVLHDNGNLRIFTARIEGFMVGYAVFVITYNPHYKTKLQAEHDLLWLSPPYRKGFTGIKFIKFIIDTLKRSINDGQKISVIGFTSSSAYPIAPLLERIGFKPAEQKFFMEV